MAEVRKSLKLQNVKWFTALWTVDAIVVWTLLQSERPPPRVSPILPILASAPLSVGIPLAAFAVAYLVPPKVRDALIFWRWHDALPGCRAFTSYLRADPRIDVEAIEEKHSPLPTEPEKQNRLWYKLFKACEEKPEVSFAHQMFLLFRDAAIISTVALLLLPISAAFLGWQWHVWLRPCSLFIAQYLLSMLLARNAAIRLVTTVLAVSSIDSDKK